MLGVNQATILGTLGRDPEVREMSNGNRVCNFSLATNERWKGKNGKTEERTEWHRIVIFNENLIELAEEYLKKGDKCYVQGKLQTREWEDKDGVTRYSTEIVLGPYNSTLQLVGGNGDDRGRNSRRDDGDGYRSDRVSGRGNSSGGKNRRQTVEDLDDDIPFAWIGALIAPALALLSMGGLA